MAHGDLAGRLTRGICGFLIAAGLLLSGGVVYAADPPHSSGQSIGCSDCHVLHVAPGPNLTTEATNVLLCQSCHNPAGMAAAKSMITGQADPESGIGKHHSWEGSMPSSSSPSNTYGLRAVADLSSADMQIRLQGNGGKLGCSVCHNQHSQAMVPWDPASPSTPGTSGRHFMRAENDMNQLCEDCHFYRAMNYTRARGEDLEYQPDGTKKFSHPVSITMNASGQGYDRAVPLDGDGSEQTGLPRCAGDADGNAKNNFVFDTGGKVRCLSCHGIHYTDSNTRTQDGP